MADPTAYHPLTWEEFTALGLLAELARVFRSEAQATELLDGIQYPVTRHSSFTAAQPAHFWRGICENVDNGLTIGGLPRLLARAAGIYPGNRHFDPLACNLILGLARGLPERGSCPLPRVDACYQGICREWGVRPQPASLSGTPISYAWELVDYMVSPANPRSPLLAFVRGLRPLFPDCATGLAEWEDQAVAGLSGRYGVSAEALRGELSRGASQGQCPVGGDYWLSIVVQRGKLDRDPFTVKGWLSLPGEPDMAPVWDEPIFARWSDRFRDSGIVMLPEQEAFAVAEQGLPTCVAALREAAHEQILARGQQVPEEQFHIEVFLPRVLLCREADQWLIPEQLSGDAIPVGVVHPFVVRCVERWENPTARNALNNRWKHILSQIASPKLVHRLPVDDYAAYWLADPALSEEGSHALRQSGQVVCILIGAPLDGSGSPAFPFCGRILQAGVPAVVWVRQPHGAGRANPRAALTGLVQSGPLQSLCRAVWQARRQARPERGSAQSWRNIGLLYEDANRVPPDLVGRRLSAPVGRRSQ